MSDPTAAVPGHRADDPRALVFAAIRELLDAPPDTSEGRPPDDVLRRELRGLSAILQLESDRLNQLADELGTAAPPSDTALLQALSDGAAQYAAGRSHDQAARWIALHARLAAAGPLPLPPGA